MTTYPKNRKYDFRRLEIDAQKFNCEEFEMDGGTATATAGAATLNSYSGKITSEAITTAAAADYVLTLTNSRIAATDIVLPSVANGTNTTEGLAINRVQAGAGSVVIRVRNTHASSALNGTIVISFVVVKQ
jgi:hypothetical protein